MESDPESSPSGTPRSIYEETGDSAAALHALQQREGKNTSTNPYNEFLCQSMVGKRPLSSKWLKQLQNKEEETDVLVIEQKIAQSASLTVLCRWIKAYNKGLALLMCHKPNETWDLLWSILNSEVIENKHNYIRLPIADSSSNGNNNNHDDDDDDGNDDQKSSSQSTRQPEEDEMIHVACQMAFLLLQAILSPNFDSSKWPTLQQHYKATLTWLESAIADQDNLNKFLLTLIQSNLELSSNHKVIGTVNDHNIRTARKELKHAMEIFQHKLKKSNTSTQDNCHETSALNLKANTERLKGNVKKSLVLLGETKIDDDDDPNVDHVPKPESLTDPFEIMQQMEHYNNLALVYHSNGKPNLAIHAWSKALSYATSDQQASAILQSNGTPQTNHQISILYNASLSCLQHQNYSAAYQCMSIVSKHWVHRADCWLRLAEACIGWYSELKANHSTDFGAIVDSNGQLNGMLLQNSNLPDLNPSSLADVVGSPTDLAQLGVNPLPRASFCLRKCLNLLEGKHHKSERDQLVSMSAHLSFSYICLEQRDYPKTLHYAGFVVQNAPSLMIACSEREIKMKKGGGDGSSSHVALKAIVERQVATGRMYGAEASCALGDALASMGILVHGGNSDAIDRLASDLAAVTLEEAAKNPSGKARLAKAQAMVRCNASAVSAHMNHLGPAKQLAMSAQAMENAYQNTSASNGPAASGDASGKPSTAPNLPKATSQLMYAKRVLAYCMMREGNTSAALNIFRSAR